MVNLEGIILQISGIAITAFFALLGFLAGQVAIRLIIEPFQRYLDVHGEINTSLIYYKDEYGNPGSGNKERMNEASQKLRQLAGQLMAKTSATRFYGRFEKFYRVGKFDDNFEASKKLIRISNNIHSGDGSKNLKEAENIGNILKFRVKIQ